MNRLILNWAIMLRVTRTNPAKFGVDRIGSAVVAPEYGEIYSSCDFFLDRDRVPKQLKLLNMKVGSNVKNPSSNPFIARYLVS